MLYKTLHFLESQLNDYFLGLETAEQYVPNPVVVLENIGALDEEGFKNTNNLLITLVNISEEFTLKNTPPQLKDANFVTYKNPEIFLNLYLLFAACMKKYSHALIYLSHVIKFFQGKNTFTSKNSFTNLSGLDNFKISLDLYSPTFEQANYLWSTLGGKQYPFVLYKLRLVVLERESTKETRGLIKEIQVNDDINVTK